MQIITIDFDIIMDPSIEFYNHLVGSKNLLNDPLLKLSPADLIHYQRLTLWLIQQTKHLSVNDIIFINSHESIINYVSEDDVIINIDHHHDLGYKKTEFDDNNIHCGNWA